MLDIKAYENDARELSRHVITKWEEYDFAESGDELERRVPKMEIVGNLDVEIDNGKVECFRCFGCEKFVRHYNVVYRDRKYSFIIMVEAFWNCVKRFTLLVYGVTEKESVKLIAERL